MKSRRKRTLYACLILIILTAISCVSLPKVAELPPIQEYGPERTDWDTSATCVVLRGEQADMSNPYMSQMNQGQAATNPYVAQMLQVMAERNAMAFATAESSMVQFLQDRGYTVVPKVDGYLTREQRKSVDKVVRIDSTFCNYVAGSDGTCTDANMVVTVYDIERESVLEACSAVARVMGAKKEPAKHTQATEQAVKNLFTLDNFRQALCK